MARQSLGGGQPQAGGPVVHHLTPSLSLFPYGVFTHRTESAMTYCPGVPWLSKTAV